MKRLSIAVAVMLASPMLAACPGPLGDIASPSQVAQHTTADEQAMLRAEQGYKLARTIGELGVDTGLIRGPTATRIADLDNRLFAALQAARAAYRAFNSPGLISAAGEVSRLADEIQRAVRPQGGDQ